ncbi:MAG: hypothetical protein NTX92_08300 [Euryarchaeota archaeon]|nr:hypothetical protein [Euryarchaeota archaeon]
MNKFNIGDILIPIEGQGGNTWIVLQHPHQLLCLHRTVLARLFQKILSVLLLP